MIYGEVDAGRLQNRELANAVKRLQRLTDGGYDLYDKNNAAILRLLKKAIKLAKAEEEWYIYFDGIYDIIYQLSRSGNNREIVKYAEVFYQAQEQYMDKVLPGYQGTNLSYLNTWIYGMIFDAYENFHQIDDAKMEVFMRKFEETALKYGKTFTYYKAEMNLANLYRDKKMAAHGRRYFEKYERELLSCYICGHKQFLGYYLLLDKKEKAEQLMLDYINRNIPRQHQWCYARCESAQPRYMYCQMLQYCLMLDKAAFFRYFYESYWLKQPVENRRIEEDSGWRSFSRYMCAAAGDFGSLEQDLRVAEKDMEEEAQFDTIINMQKGLEWYCYFTLLERSGIEKVALELPGMELSGPEAAGLEPEADGAYSCRAVCRYMERRADVFGRKFDKAREKFDYASVKKTYLECAGV